MSDSSEEKSLPASDEKLRKAREKGQIPHSKEMVTASVTVACFAYVVLRLPAFATYLEDGLTALPQSYDAPFADAAKAMIGRLGADALAAILPLVGLVVVAAVVTNIAVNGGLVVSLHPVTPDAQKINPVEGFKRLFGVKNTIELVRSLLKLAVASYLVFYLIRGSLQALVEIPSCGLACGTSAFGELLRRLLLVMAGLFLALGVLDIGIQRWLFMRDQRMSVTEQKRERKDSDGDPEIKKRQREERHVGRAKAGLRNANFAIRSADLVLAMRYTEDDSPVPILLGRGRDEGYSVMLDELRSLGVPVVADADAVAQIAPGLKVGGAVTKEMFEPVIRCMREAGVL